MEKNIRLEKTQTFGIGILTTEIPHGINVRPGSFTMVSEDDIAYLMSTCSLLQKGWLQVHQENKKQEVLAQLGIDPADEPAFMSEEEIRKKLNGNANTLKKWLDGIDDAVILDRIGEIAKSMNLNINKVRLLEAKMPYKEF